MATPATPPAQPPEPVPAPARSRHPQKQRRRRLELSARNQLVALGIILMGTLLGWVVPHSESWLPKVGLTYDAGTAQAALAAIAGAMITLSGFVITALTLVLQTVQSMSPRLVGALRHMGRYLSLFALLVGTALYALVALSQISGDTVPRLTVTFAVGLVLGDAVAVLYMLASLRNAVTGGGLARAVGERLRQVVDASFPTRLDDAPTPITPSPATPLTWLEVPGPDRPGVLQSFDERHLVRLLARADARLELTVTVGEFVSSRTALGRLGVPSGAAAMPPRLPELVAACARYGPTRTVEQDPSYGFRLLADISIRALSPAVNDPTTAVQSLDQIEEGLLRIASRTLGPALLLDDDSIARVAYPAPEWPDLVALALDETLLYGAGNPQVVRRARALLDRVEAATPPERREALTARRALLDRLSSAALPDPFLHALASVPDPFGLGGPT
ncbi:DUF2254 family protein [Streptacidiphilus jiangxiensis]|uniref:Uncharacterized membrane protein n=1 Tax=Streptacidiphilus jiangxiensis TaxID=235985 RepID=A0A1H7VZD0_STRJI|nr:DUF2254 family protein [Streptacidiphilus jiangxiensis]SEM14591.1 Uncharacterized membrane protein [Streptacidiphilus jiangxiensis]